MKKNGNEDLDIPMGCYDGAEVCELVGSFVLNCLEHVFTKDEIGLYRDDGLGITRNASGPEIGRKTKRIIDISKQYGLTIVMHTNVKVVDFLDVRVDLNSNTFKAYRKPNNVPVYVNKQANHPTSINSQIPRNVTCRISKLSSNKEIYSNGMPLYEKLSRKVDLMN